MKIYPAIDIKNGCCVRLVQGDFGKTTVYGDNPAKTALKWQSCGASYLHLVDLDGTRYGTAHNDAAVKELLSAVSIPVQIGGGLRSIEAVRNKFEMGISRVILGTAALVDKDLLLKAIDEFGEKIAVGIDVKNGFAAMMGWQTVTEKSMRDICIEMIETEVKTIISTDISRDGMMEGPNTAMYRELTQHKNLNVIASGGVSSLQDIDMLFETGVEGVIIGTALYTGAVDLREAVKKYE
ncbi:MAG: 1-(5-phosphoribosyl)-5-[(5-phosphoribosylamino)methylideneamino]imidazole-4-carboxamide isomerase [Defluviitaleaceae bacterium]|nr:1-(5-phosphoribosyl)-5-[(5-phosphoribosylamino)methylideneamino]imidazole-4-carboxamide isomerase [Defluviitaleaceae bacterium]